MSQKQNMNDFKIVIGEIQKKLKNYIFNCICENCLEPAIISHSQQKEGQLRVIAKREGHVYTLDRNFYRNIKRTEKGNSVLLTKTPIKRASTFPGFCSFHDDLIFKPIEQRQLDLHDSEQATLLFLRAISFEYAQKRNAKILYEEFKSRIDNGAPAEFLENLESLLGGINLFLEREGPIVLKSIFDIITKRDYESFHTSWVRYPQTLPISTSTILCPWLNNYYEKWSSERPQPAVSFSIIPNYEYTDVICSWMNYSHEDSIWIQEEMNSSEGLERVINLFGISESEDLCFNMDFWDSLTEENKNIVASEMVHSMHKGPTINMPSIIKLSKPTTEPINPGDPKKQGT